MATEVISTIRSSGGDYTSLSSWEAGEQTNLVTADQIATAECYDDWASGLSDEVTISGWTTDSTRYVKVTVAAGHRHDGTPQSGFFIKISSSSGLAVVTASQNYTRLEYLDVENTRSSAFRCGISLGGQAAIADKCIAKSGTVYGCSGYYVSAYESQVRNSLAYNSTIGVSVASSNAQVVYNNISANCTTGFALVSSVAKNNCAYSCTTDYTGGSGSSATNATSAAATTNVPGTGAMANIVSGDFANAASNDFHLSSGSVLRGAGTNLYSTFTTDIDGDTWPSSGAWDIGFDYYVASSSLPTLTNITLSNITTSGYRATVAGS